MQSMNRRKFIASISQVGAAVAAGELLVPQRTIFLPPRGGWWRDFSTEDMCYRHMEMMWVTREVLENSPLRSLYTVASDPFQNLLLVRYSRDQHMSARLVAWQQAHSL